MTQRYNDSAVQAKINFAENFDASVERDRREEEASGGTDPRVEERRRSLYTFATAGLEPEPSY